MDQRKELKVQFGDHVPVEKVLLRLPEVCQAMGLGRSTVYKMLDQPGGLPTIRIGGAIRVSTEVLRNWIAQQSDGDMTMPNKPVANNDNPTRPIDDMFEKLSEIQTRFFPISDTNYVAQKYDKIKYREGHRWETLPDWNALPLEIQHGLTKDIASLVRRAIEEHLDEGIQALREGHE